MEERIHGVCRNKRETFEQVNGKEIGRFVAREGFQLLFHIFIPAYHIYKLLASTYS